MTEYEKRVNARARAICLDDDPVRCADGCKPASDGKCHYWDNARATFAQDEADGYALAREAGLRSVLEEIVKADEGALEELESMGLDNISAETTEFTKRARAALNSDGSEMLAEWKPTHRHKKTGGLYRVVGHGINEADMSPAVVYENKDRIVWIRPHDEFHDGRFEALDKLQEKRGG